MAIPTGALPLLPLKNTVLYPGVTQTFRVGRDKSIKAVEAATQLKSHWIIAVTQKNQDQPIEKADDLYNIGTLAKIESVKGSGDNNSFFVTVRGQQRMKITSFPEDSTEYMSAHVEPLDDDMDIDSSTNAALLQSLKTICSETLKLVPANTDQIQELIDGIDDLVLMNHLAISNIDLPSLDKQKILETISVKDKTMLTLDYLRKVKESLSLQNDIKQKLSQKLGQNHREHLLREQLKTIKEELGDESNDSIVDDYREKIEQAGMHEEAYKLASNQLKKLENSSSQSPEHQMIRSHLDLLVSLPWSKSSVSDDFSIEEAERILDKDHYGLTKIKKRILQHLSVLKLKKDKKGSILLFLGPPGVGKTSLGQSIAKALGKKYQRISLGGVRDESEIRGHRRTYIGALPGRIINSLKKAGENDPVFVLDEIDKMSRGFSGDPASAMLEVLDPEQNSTFADHYLDTTFDLSKIFFIATANSLEGIPLPLLDRMEVIDLAGYTTPEKFHIAKTHLLPKQLEEHGQTSDQVQIDDEALLKIISHYTREAGVRKLQQKIAELCRYTGEKIIRGENKVQVKVSDLNEILGPEVFSSEIAETMAQPGVVTGLAWTPVGGDILFIETALIPGKGDLIITGQLGDVMKESAQIAKSLIKARMAQLAPMFDFSKFDIHLHVPSGAIPKDGPSAGVTLLTSLASLVSRKPVNPKLAMTGEITLRGKVMPVGGIKEKVIAAHRAGITEIILCDKNKKDLADIPTEIQNDLKFHFVENINQVLSIALEVDLFDWQEDTMYKETTLIPYTSTDA